MNSGGVSHKPSITVLLSGGLDSSACVAFYKKQQFSISTLFIDYGQAAADKERRASRQLAKYFKVQHRELKLLKSYRKSSGEVRARNAVLMLTALMEITHIHGLIAIGIHSGTPYYDCTSTFINSIQTLFDGYTNGCIRAVAPFAKMTKLEVWQYFLESNVPVQLTYSCQKGGNKPCGRCESCRDRKKINALSNNKVDA